MRINLNPSPAAARYLLKLRFPREDIERMRALSAKAQVGALLEAENAELDTYERVGCLLDILHSKARRILKRQT